MFSLIYNKFSIKKTFTLIEMILVIIIIWILMTILLPRLTNVKDVQSIKNTFVNSVVKHILQNRIRTNNGIDYDIPLNACPNGDPEQCNWKDNCIVGKYNWEQLSDWSLNFKSVVSWMINYKLCPKYLPDGSRNTNYATESHQNPSFHINFKVNNMKYKLNYPTY